jgi:hypothetical protein
MYASEIFLTISVDKNWVLVFQVEKTGINFPPIYHGLNHD